MDIVNDVVNTLAGNPASVVNDIADGISALTGAGSLQQTPLVAGTNPFLKAFSPRPFPYRPPEIDPNQLLQIIQQLLGLLSQVLGSRFQPRCDNPEVETPGAPGLGGSPAGASIDPGYCPQPGSEGIGGLLDNLNTGAISNQVNSLMQAGEQAAMNGDPLTAQKDMEKAQIMFQTISNLMNVIGELQKTAVQNSKLG